MTQGASERSLVSRRRRVAAIASLTLGFAALTAVWFTLRADEEPAPSEAGVITKPAPRECTWGRVRLGDVTTNEFLRLTDGRGPTWLPGSFGLAHTWGDPEGRIALAGWSDEACREVVLSLEPGIEDLPNASVGPWSLVADVDDQCGNLELGNGRCLQYAAVTPDGMTLRLQMIGVEQPEGDEIARSVPLKPGSVSR
jgi:hypothetical protein